MNNGDHSLLKNGVRAQVNELRDRLCEARIEASEQRQKYTEDCRVTRDSVMALKQSIGANRSKATTSKSYMNEFDNLLRQFEKDSEAVSTQLERVKRAESQVYEYEAYIEKHGVWLVQIPECASSKHNEVKKNGFGHKRKDSGVEQCD